MAWSPELLPDLWVQKDRPCLGRSLGLLGSDLPVPWGDLPVSSTSFMLSFGQGIGLPEHDDSHANSVQEGPVLDSFWSTRHKLE